MNIRSNSIMNVEEVAHMLDVFLAHGNGLESNDHYNGLCTIKSRLVYIHRLKTSLGEQSQDQNANNSHLKQKQQELSKCSNDLYIDLYIWLQLDEFKKILSCEGIDFGTVLYFTMLTLAKIDPINAIDAITQEKIAPENAVYTSDRYQHDINELVVWVQQKFVNPWTNLSFNSLDEFRLRKVVREFLCDESVKLNLPEPMDISSLVLSDTEENITLVDVDASDLDDDEPPLEEEDGDHQFSSTQLPSQLEAVPETHAEYHDHAQNAYAGLPQLVLSWLFMKDDLHRENYPENLGGRFDNDLDYFPPSVPHYWPSLSSASNQSTRRTLVSDYTRERYGFERNMSDLRVQQISDAHVGHMKVMEELRSYFDSSQSNSNSLIDLRLESHTHDHANSEENLTLVDVDASVSDDDVPPLEGESNDQQSSATQVRDQLEAESARFFRMTAPSDSVPVALAEYHDNAQEKEGGVNLKI